MISDATISRILDAANIVDVVSDYVTLKRTGASYKGLCPFHDDKTPSFSVSPARGVCKCFSCGKGGNAVHFIMEMEQATYPEALKLLAKRFGIPVEEEEMTDELREQMNRRERMFAVNEWAAQYFNHTMLNHPDGRAVGLAYFHSRGVRDDIIARFRLGFCLDSPTEMSSAARAKGHSVEVLANTGLCVKRDNGTVYDRFRGRAIFPWIGVNGKVVAFGGRVLDARTKGVNQKYVNSPDSEIYHKSDELYGIFQAKKQISKEKHVYMVEGYTDVLAMHQCGIENVVANSGTALNDAQIRLLRRFTQDITLIYDSDEAGIKATLRGTDMLLAQGMNVKVLLLPEGDDPDSFARKHSAQEFKDYVAANETDVILFKTNRLSREAQRDPIKRAQMIESVVKSIAVIPDELVRSTYIHECAQILNMDEGVLVRSATKQRADIIQQKREEARKEHDRAIYLQQRAQQENVTAGSSAGDTQTDKTPAASGERDRDNTVSTEFPPHNAPAPVTQEPPTPDTPPQTTPTPQPSVPIIRNDNDRFDLRYAGLERLIMTFVTRFGEKLIECENPDDPDGAPIKVTLAEHVRNDLMMDGLELRNPIYVKMLDQACAHIRDVSFEAARFLLNHPDEEINRTASDLLVERHQLSKIYKPTKSEEEMMEGQITRLMLDYKYLVVEDELCQCNKKLASPEVKNDTDQMIDLMRQIRDLGNVQRQLAELLGKSVIAK